MGRLFRQISSRGTDWRGYRLAASPFRAAREILWSIFWSFFAATCSPFYFCIRFSTAPSARFYFLGFCSRASHGKWLVFRAICSHFYFFVRFSFCFWPRLRRGFTFPALRAEKVSFWPLFARLKPRAFTFSVIFGRFLGGFGNVLLFGRFQKRRRWNRIKNGQFWPFLVLKSSTRFIFGRFFNRAGPQRATMRAGGLRVQKWPNLAIFEIWR